MSERQTIYSLAKEFHLDSKTVKRLLTRTDFDTKWDHNGNLIFSDESRSKILEYVELKKNKETKVVQVDKQIYSMLSLVQLRNLANTIDEQLIIPLKYTYQGKGSNDWENYNSKAGKNKDIGTQNKVKEDTNTINRYLFSILESFRGYDKINILDIGAGDGTPVIPIIRGLQERNKMGEYYGVDISDSLREIARQNIFNSTEVTPTQMTRIDLESESLAKLYSTIQNNSVNPCLVVYLAGPTFNSQYPSKILENIRDGLGRNDIVLMTDRVYYEGMEDNFEIWDYPEIKKRILRIPKYLGIEPEDYEVIKSYDDNTKRRNIYLELNKSIQVIIPKLNDHSITLAKSSKLNVWTHKTGIDICEMFYTVNNARFKVKLMSEVATTGVLFVLSGEYAN